MWFVNGIIPDDRQLAIVSCIPKNLGLAGSARTGVFKKKFVSALNPQLRSDWCIHDGEMLRVYLAVLLLGIGASSLWGQRTIWSDPAFEGVGLAGGSFMNDKQFLTQVSGSSEEVVRTVGFHYASGYIVGARVNQNLNDYWNADLEYSFANQPLRITNLSPTIPSLELGQSVHHFSYSVSYIPLGGWERFRPYVRAGAGATLFYLHGDTRDAALAQGVQVRDSWNFTLNWGGGFKCIMNENALLVFDVKDYLSSVPSYGLAPSARVVNGQFQPGVATSGLLQNLQVSIGIAVRWNDQ